MIPFFKSIIKGCACLKKYISMTFDEQYVMSYLCNDYGADTEEDVLFCVSEDEREETAHSIIIDHCLHKGLNCGLNTLLKKRAELYSLKKKIMNEQMRSSSDEIIHIRSLRKSLDQEIRKYINEKHTEEMRELYKVFSEISDHAHRV